MDRINLTKAIDEIMRNSGVFDHDCVVSHDVLTHVLTIATMHLNWNDTEDTIESVMVHLRHGSTLPYLSIDTDRLIDSVAVLRGIYNV